MNEKTVWVACFVDSEFREARGLGVFEDKDKAVEHCKAMEKMARDNKVDDGMTFLVFRSAMKW